MERILMLRLESIGCMAEAVLNGIPLGRTPKGGGVLALPVHEYTLSGANQLALVIEPPPLAPGFEQSPPRPHLSDAGSSASLRLLLRRVGLAVSHAEARVLAEVEWFSPVAEVIEFPISIARHAHLPVSFPRWRWADAPVIASPDTMKPQVAAFLQGIALALAQGQAEVFVAAARLRFEELAQAYHRSPADDLAHFRAHVQQTYGEEPIDPVLPSAQNILLRLCADGRMFDCLGMDGLPALRSAATSARRKMWPVRVAKIDGRLYVLR